LSNKAYFFDCSFFVIINSTQIPDFSNIPSSTKYSQNFAKDISQCPPFSHTFKNKPNLLC
jgi:hypothetical protein